LESFPTVFKYQAANMLISKLNTEAVCITKTSAYFYTIMRTLTPQGSFIKVKDEKYFIYNTSRGDLCILGYFEPVTFQKYHDRKKHIADGVRSTHEVYILFLIVSIRARAFLAETSTKPYF
jgi:hypothetical protein